MDDLCDVKKVSSNYEILLNLIKSTMCITKINDVEEGKIRKIITVLNRNNIDDFSEIIKIGSGTYSTVYKIKDKVLKIGLAKKDEKIFDANNIVPCFFKTNLSMETKIGKMVIGIEMQELVDMRREKSIDMLYDVYVNLRNGKMIWTDVKESNVGFFNDRLVVIDTDSIYSEDDNNIYWFTALAKQFEERYMKQKDSR